MLSARISVERQVIRIFGRSAPFGLHFWALSARSQPKR